jgi:hypothetical protein
MFEKYTDARSLYEAVGYRLQSERQKQIITLKAPLGDGQYGPNRARRAAPIQAVGRHLKLNFGLLRLSNARCDHFNSGDELHCGYTA